MSGGQGSPRRELHLSPAKREGKGSSCHNNKGKKSNNIHHHNYKNDVNNGNNNMMVQIK